MLLQLNLSGTVASCSDLSEGWGEAASEALPRLLRDLLGIPGGPTGMIWIHAPLREATYHNNLGHLASSSASYL